MKSVSIAPTKIVLDAGKLLGFRIKSAAAIGAKFGSKTVDAPAA